MEPIVLIRPLPVRATAAVTLAVITGWAALNADLSDVGVLAYPAIIAVQTVREWLWRLVVGPEGLHETQGIGAPRDIAWAKVEALLMPDSTWWRVNPALKIIEAPNVQLTAAPEVAAVVALAQDRHKPVLGSPTSVSLARTLVPWILLLVLSGVLFAAEVVGVSASSAG